MKVHAVPALAFVAAAALALTAFGALTERDVPRKAGFDCNDKSCSNLFAYLYTECDLPLYGPTTGDPLDMANVVHACDHEADPFVMAVYQCLLAHCGNCQAVEDCIDPLYDDEDDDAADDDALDDDSDDGDDGDDSGEDDDTAPVHPDVEEEEENDASCAA